MTFSDHKHPIVITDNQKTAGRPLEPRGRGRRKLESRIPRSPGRPISQGIYDSSVQRMTPSHEPPKLECEKSEMVRMGKLRISPKGRLPKTLSKEGMTRESSASLSSSVNMSTYCGQRTPPQHLTFHAEGGTMNSMQRENTRRSRSVLQKSAVLEQSAAYSSDTLDSEPPELEIEAPLAHYSKTNIGVIHSESSTTTSVMSSLQKSSVEASTETETSMNRAPLCEIGIQAEPELQTERGHSMDAPKEQVKKNVDVGIQVDPAEALALMAAAERPSTNIQSKQSEVAVQATQTDQGTDPMVPLEIQVDFEVEPPLTSRRSQGQSPMSTRSPRLRMGTHQNAYRMSPSLCSPRSTGTSHSPMSPCRRCTRSPLITSPSQTSPSGNTAISVSTTSPLRHSRNGSPRGRPRKSTAVCVSPDTTVSSPPQLSLHSPGSQSDGQVSRNSQYSRPRHQSLSPKCPCDLENDVGTTSHADSNKKQHSYIQNSDLGLDLLGKVRDSSPPNDSTQGKKQAESPRQHDTSEENMDVCVIEDSDRDVIIIDEDDDDTSCGQCAQLQQAAVKQVKKRSRGRPRKHGNSHHSRSSNRLDSECEVVEAGGSKAVSEQTSNKKKKKHGHRSACAEKADDVTRPSSDTTTLDALSSFFLFKEPSLFMDDPATMHKVHRSDYEPLPQLKKRRRRVDDDMGYSKPRRKRRKKRHTLLSATEDESTTEEPEAR